MRFQRRKRLSIISFEKYYLYKTTISCKVEKKIQVLRPVDKVAPLQDGRYTQSSPRRPQRSRQNESTDGTKRQKRLQSFLSPSRACSCGSSPAERTPPPLRGSTDKHDSPLRGRRGRSWRLSPHDRLRIKTGSETFQKQASDVKDSEGVPEARRGLKTSSLTQRSYGALISCPRLLHLGAAPGFHLKVLKKGRESD